MRRTLMAVMILMTVSFTAAAQERIEFKEWLVCGPKMVFMPAFADIKDVDNESFEAGKLMETLQLRNLDEPALAWRVVGAKGDALKLEGEGQRHITLLRAYLQVGRWTKGALLLKANGLVEVFLDDKSVFSRKNSGDQEERIEMKLTRGKHRISVKLLAEEAELSVQAAFEADQVFAGCSMETGINPQRTLTVNDILEGEQLASARISPSGRYLLIQMRDIAGGSGKNRGYRSIYDLNARKNIALLRGEGLGSMQWLPRSDKLSYTLSSEDAEDLMVYDVLSGVERKIVSGLKQLADYHWSPTEDRIVFSRYVEADKPGELKRIYGVEDRLPYFRNRSTLHLADVATGLVHPLTAGNLSADFHDFSPEGNRILFSTSRMDYREVPFQKQNLYEMDLNAMTTETVWQDKLYHGYAQYSPDGLRLLVSGSPETFAELGVKVRKGRIPNASDGQIYIMDLKTRKVDAVSRDFDPAVESVHWCGDGKIYLKVGEKDYGRLYRYDPKEKRYQHLPLPVEVLDRIDFDRNGRKAVFNGSGVSVPDKLFLMDLKSGRSQMILFPGQEKYRNIQFGKCEAWDFVNRNGESISGRVYYPLHYDESKKYPVIVNFYGGTSPIERTFGGRYPIETWAAAGYMIYVLQPSGATGFGQDFSALHVNGWGFDAIDDIIDGTKAFLAAHPQADSANVGCIGASYGGYTTMLIQTRTDIFKTAISHAGISSISSYWGEGYWGYSYNTTSAKFSYPWNRKDIYVENSPLYNADKFKNSILLLHGTDDTNVPVGESLQYYAALKLLGKDVEMVLVEGQDHWILDYSKRVKWHHTIVSWFDKKLKDQPQQWDDLYPGKNY